MNATEFLFELSPPDYWCNLIKMVAGENHGLEVGVINASGYESVEIFGELPMNLSAELPKARYYWEATRRGEISADDVPIVWHTTPDGYGKRYGIRSQDDLVGLLMHRKALMEGAK